MPDDYERSLQEAKGHLPRRIWRVCFLVLCGYTLTGGKVDRREEAMARTRAWHVEQSDSSNER